MNQLVQDIRSKRLKFTLLFIALTAIYGLISYLGEGKITEQVQQYIVLGWRISLALLSLWFGYAVGISKQTTWFMSLLAILPIVSWVGVLYLLFKSGSMLVEAKKTGEHTKEKPKAIKAAAKTVEKTNKKGKNKK